MSDRIERPRDEGIYITPIEKDKRQQSRDLPHKEKEKQLLYASFFSMLMKVFEQFPPSKKFSGTIIEQQAIIDHLHQLDHLLESLSKENLSRSVEFTTELSEIWGLLLEDFEAAEILERKNLEKIVPFRQLIETLKNYPEDSDHRLGYYLLQHAGKDWLPFPFIELLLQLHEEKGTLQKWRGVIGKVIESLQYTPPPPNNPS